MITGGDRGNDVPEDRSFPLEHALQPPLGRSTPLAGAAVREAGHLGLPLPAGREEEPALLARPADLVERNITAS